MVGGKPFNASGGSMFPSCSRVGPHRKCNPSVLHLHPISRSRCYGRTRPCIDRILPAPTLRLRGLREKEKRNGDGCSRPAPPFLHSRFWQLVASSDSDRRKQGSDVPLAIAVWTAESGPSLLVTRSPTRPLSRPVRRGILGTPFHFGASDSLRTVRPMSWPTTTFSRTC